MARINLLPWREWRRRERRDTFLKVAGGCIVLAAVIVFAVKIHFDRLIDHQEDRNQFLDTEIAKLERKIEEIEDLEEQRDKLLARKRVIEQLQRSRAQMVHLFDELVRTIPEGAYLEAIEQNGAELVLKGRAQSNARVSTYMRNIESSQWLAEPRLDVIEAIEGDARQGFNFKFSLRAKLVQPGDKDEQSAAVGTVG